MSKSQNVTAYKRRIAEALTAHHTGDYSALAKETVEELARLAFSRISDMGTFGPNGFTLKDSSELTDEELAAIGRIETRETKRGMPVVTVTLWPKPKALEMLLRICGLMIDRREVQQVGPIEIEWPNSTIGGSDED